MKRIMSVVTIVMHVMTASVLCAEESVYSIAIDETAGSVSQRYRGDQQKTIIHIQDAHASLDAQENIVSLIAGLVNSGVTHLVNVEGASGEIDLSEYRAFPVHEARDSVAHEFVTEGKFSGVECAAITSREELVLNGVEETQLFRENLQSFVDVVNKREDILSALDEIENALQDLKTPLLNETLKSFDEAVCMFAEGTSSLYAVLEVLFNHLDVEDIDPLRFVNLVEAHNMIAQQYAFIEDSAKAEQAELRLRVEERVGARDLSEVSEYEVTQYVKNQAIDLGISLKQYPNLNGYCKYLNIKSRINFNDLMVEIGQAAYRIRMSLAQSQEEREMVTLWQQVTMLRNVMTLRAERHEAAYVHNHRDAFAARQFTQYIQRQSKKYGVSCHISVDEGGFDAVLSAAEHFYREAARRDQALVDNTIRAMDQKGATVSVLVSGGFHSKGIVKKLKSKGLNYLVVMPKIDSFDATVPYVERMTGQLAPTQVQMASFINELLTALGQFKGELNTRSQYKALELMSENAISVHAFSALKETFKDKSDLYDAMLSRMMRANEGGKGSAEFRTDGIAMLDSYAEIVSSVSDLMAVDTQGVEKYRAVDEFPREVRDIATVDEPLAMSVPGHLVRPGFVGGIKRKIVSEKPYVLYIDDALLEAIPVEHMPRNLQGVIEESRISLEERFAQYVSIRLGVAEGDIDIRRNMPEDVTRDNFGDNSSVYFFQSVDTTSAQESQRVVDSVKATLAERGFDSRLMVFSEKTRFVPEGVFFQQPLEYMFERLLGEVAQGFPVDSVALSVDQYVEVLGSLFGVATERQEKIVAAVNNVAKLKYFTVSA